MIPRFNELGYLPPGIHPATVDEIATRFGQASGIRRVQMDSVRWMVDLAAQAGVERIILNGSFVTDIMEPNDVDCVLLTGSGYPNDWTSAKSLDDGLPFLETAVVLKRDFDILVNKFFATDRFGHRKGVVEVIQWN